MKFFYRIAPYLAIAVVFGACMLLAFCALRDRPDPAPAQVKIVQDELDVGANVSDMRVEDAVRAEKQQQEIEDAVANSTGPDDLRARRGCVILRQQGRDTSKIAACHP